MFKLTMLGVLLLKGFIVSGYFAFFHGQHRQVKVKLLEGTGDVGLAMALNKFVRTNPTPELNQLIDDLNWIMEHDMSRDIRVKRLIHQDLKSLVEITNLRKNLSEVDYEIQQAYDQSFQTICERARNLRTADNRDIRNEILILSDMIEGNDK